MCSSDLGHTGKRRDPKDYSEILRKFPEATNPFAAFMLRPKIHFETQDRDEQVLLLLRRHFITNLGWIVTTMVMLFVPALGSIFELGFLPANFWFVGTLFWYVFVFGYAFEAFLVWYFNVYIVTDERVIDYDFYSLLYKRVSAAKIEDIQDVTYEMGGVASNLVNYGNVFIQTAAESLEIDFHEVPNPDLVVKLLNELILEEERENMEGRTT